MATQSPPQSAVFPASINPSQPGSQPRTVPGPAGSLDGVTARTSGVPGDSAPRPVEAGNNATDIVASNSLRTNEAGAGDEIKTTGEEGFLRLPAPVERLPVGLVVSVPVRDFRVRNLLAMAPDEVIETQWAHGEDLPLSSGNVQLAWSEFEVVDTRLAVRVTRLA
jgi:flagellar motor switch/type III secretory pathway protein FliN